VAKEEYVFSPTILFEYQVYLHNEEQEDHKNRLFAYLLVLPISSKHKKNY